MAIWTSGAPERIWHESLNSRRTQDNKVRSLSGGPPEEQAAETARQRGGMFGLTNCKTLVPCRALKTASFFFSPRFRRPLSLLARRPLRSAGSRRTCREPGTSRPALCPVRAASPSSMVGCAVFFSSSSSESKSERVLFGGGGRLQARLIGHRIGKKSRPRLNQGGQGSLC